MKIFAVPFLLCGALVKAQVRGVAQDGERELWWKMHMMPHKHPSSKSSMGSSKSSMSSSKSSMGSKSSMSSSKSSMSSMSSMSWPSKSSMSSSMSSMSWPSKSSMSSSMSSMSWPSKSSMSSSMSSMSWPSRSSMSSSMSSMSSSSSSMSSKSSGHGYPYRKDYYKPYSHPKDFYAYQVAKTDLILDLGGLDGRGDIYTWYRGNKLYLDEGLTKEIGDNDGYCIRVGPDEDWDCNIVVYLEGGQVHAQGPFSNKPTEMAITGGTGKYCEAGGTLKLSFFGTLADGTDVYAYDFSIKL